MSQVVLRVAHKVKLTPKVRGQIQAMLPPGAVLPSDDYIEWFNPATGMEGAVDYSKDKQARLRSIDSSVKFLVVTLCKFLNSECQTKFSEPELNNVINKIADALNKLIGQITCKQQLMEQKITELGKIDTELKLKEAQKYIANFTYYTNKILHPLLNHPAINFFEKNDTLDQKIKKTSLLLDRAECYALEREPRHTIVTVSKNKENNYRIKIAEPLAGKSDNLLENNKEKEFEHSIPIQQMRKSLKDHMQADPAVPSSSNAEQNKIYTPSSRADIDPGERNGWHSTLLLLNENGKKLFSSKIHRASHIGSRAGKREGISRKFQKNNAVKTLEHILLQQALLEVKKIPEGSDKRTIYKPFIFNTLVTPLPGLPDFKLNIDKAYAIEQFKKQYPNGISIDRNGIKYQVKFDVISLNNAVNVGRYILPTYKGKVAKQYQHFCKIAEAAANRLPDGEEKKKTLALIQELKRLLNFSLIDIFRTGSENRELVLAALAQVIAARLNWPGLLTCVSGKDRAELCDQYIKSIEEYLLVYGEVPHFDEKDQKKSDHFCDIFAANYNDRHGALLAAKNAPGATGLKTPEKYLPKKCQHAIKKLSNNPEIFEQSEALAKTNDIKKMELVMSPQPAEPRFKSQRSRSFIASPDEKTPFFSESRSRTKSVSSGDSCNDQANKASQILINRLALF